MFDKNNYIILLDRNNAHRAEGAWIKKILEDMVLNDHFHKLVVCYFENLLTLNCRNSKMVLQLFSFRSAIWRCLVYAVHQATVFFFF